MGRAPCCDKVGLKKGPWTPEEDQILMSFIEQHGHSNWRALPKQAGLLRCGKSCRLRWINYLKPDIKRGNFSREEEDTIIQLHEMMGNRWSAIAARLPGRTDNEIKNVWNTHLKKRLEQYQPTKSRPKNGRKNRDGKNVTTPTATESTTSQYDSIEIRSETTTKSTSSENNSSNSDQVASSPQESYTISEDFSSITEVLSLEYPNNNNAIEDAQVFDNSVEEISGYLPIIDETFWESQQELPLDDKNNNHSMNNMGYDFANVNIEDHHFNESLLREDIFAPVFYRDQNSPTNCGDNMEFWLDVFVQAGGVEQLPEF